MNPLTFGDYVVIVIAGLIFTWIAIHEQKYINGKDE